MKVLYVTSPAFFDADLSLIKELKKKVKLIVLLDLPSHSLKSTALNLSSQPSESAVCSGWLIPEFKNYQELLPEEFYIINRPKAKLLSWETWKMNVGIMRFIKHNQPDLVHFNNPLQFSMLMALLTRVNKIMTIHDPIPHLGESKINLLRKKLSLLFIKDVILLNNFQMQDFLKLYGLNEKRVFQSTLSVFNHNHLDISTLDNFTSTTNILFFGRITAYKGLDNLLDAFEKVIGFMPEAKLTIAGKGDFDFANHNLKGVTIINEFISPQDLNALIASSSFIVCPYIEATQSGVVMTAYAHLKPVIGTITGGLPEMIIHNRTGILVDAKNSDMLATAMIELASSREKLLQLQEGILEDYFTDGARSWKSITNKLVNIYEKIIEKKINRV